MERFNSRRDLFPRLIDAIDLADGQLIRPRVQACP